MSERKRCYSSEKAAIIWLVGAVDIIEQEVMVKLYERGKMVKGLRRSMGLFKWLGNHILDGLLSTIPQEQLINIRREMQHTYYSVGVKSVTGRQYDPAAGIFMTYDQMDVLMGCAKDQCALCTKDKAEERSCPLRRVRDILGTDVTHEKGCGYRWEE